MSDLINQCSEIRALREFLGLGIKEVSELVGVTSRAWQYWEKGLRKVPQEPLYLLDRLRELFKHILEVRSRKIKYSEMPYYLDYEGFEQDFPKPTKYKWQLWQSLMGHLRVYNYCSALTNRGIVNRNNEVYKIFIHFFENEKK